MKVTYTVLLEDDTICTVSSAALHGKRIADFIGEKVNIHLRDENGVFIEKSGKLVEVLSQDW